MTREEIIKWLDSYIKLKSERDGIITLITELEEDRAGSQLRSPELTGMPRSRKLSDPTATSAARFAALMEQYEEQEAALYDRCIEIEHAILSLPNPQQREMLRSHYLEGHEWAAVAAKKDYSISRCQHIASEGITAICESQHTIAFGPEL